MHQTISNHLIKHRYKYIPFIVSAILVVILYSFTHSKADTAPVYVGKIQPVAAGYFPGLPGTNPRVLATDSQNNLYVIDGAAIQADHNIYISKFAPDGTASTITLNAPSLAAGTTIYSMAFDASGNMYLGQNNAFHQEQNQIQKYDAQGNYVSSFGAYGTGNGQIIWPVSIAVNSSTGDIYVADISSSNTNSSIQRFDSSGNFISKFATLNIASSTADGSVYFPTSIALDSSGNVYVTDSSNHRVQKFDAAGNFLMKFGSQGSGDGQFSYPNGIAVNSDNEILVFDRYNSRVEKFDSTGQFLSQFGSLGTGDGQFAAPGNSPKVGFVLDSQGNLYATDELNSRVQKFDSLGAFVANYGKYGAHEGEIKYANAITVDASGNLYILDVDNRKVLKYDSSRTLVTSFGSDGSGDGQFGYAEDVDAGPDGNIYVMDSDNNRIVVFASNGTFVKTIGSSGSGDGQFDYPIAMAFGAAGNIYISDCVNSRVQILDSDGNYVSQFSQTDNGSIGCAEGITTDTAGNVYVADTDNDQVVKFDADGVFVSKFGSSGSGDGQFTSPTAITVSSDGTIYVTDGQNARVEVFDANGTYQTQLKELGTTGELLGRYPEGLAISNGNLYVANSNAVNNFVAIWQVGNTTPTPSPAVISSISAASTGTTATITWSTDTLASSQVAYGTSTVYSATTTEADTSPKVLSHTVSLSDLVACSTYHYMVLSKDESAQTSTSSDATFVTSGCPGPVAISSGGGGFLTPSGQVVQSLPVQASSTGESKQGSGVPEVQVRTEVKSEEEKPSPATTLPSKQNSQSSGTVKQPTSTSVRRDSVSEKPSASNKVEQVVASTTAVVASSSVWVNPNASLDATATAATAIKTPIAKPKQGVVAKITRSVQAFQQKILSFFGR